MTIESVERISTVVWLAMAVALAIAAIQSRAFILAPEERRGRISRALIWGGFLAFTFSWLPLGAFGIIMPPVSWFFIEALVAMPMDDGWGVPRFGHSHVIYGAILGVSFVLATALAFWRISAKSKP